VHQHSTRGAFKYDVAISTAARERPLAVALDRALTKHDLRVFYYVDRLADSLGAHGPEYMQSIYEDHSYACVVLASPEYVVSKHTRAELKYATSRQMREDREYLLVIQVEAEAVSLSGVPRANYFLSLAECDIEEAARRVARKVLGTSLGKSEYSAPKPPQALLCVAGFHALLPPGVGRRLSETALMLYLGGDYAAAREQFERARLEAPGNHCLTALYCAARLAHTPAEQMAMHAADNLNGMLSETAIHGSTVVARLAKQLLLIVRNDYYDAKNRTAAGLDSARLFDEVMRMAPSAEERAVLSRTNASPDSLTLLRIG